MNIIVGCFGHINILHNEHHSQVFWSINVVLNNNFCSFLTGRTMNEVCWRCTNNMICDITVLFLMFDTVVRPFSLYQTFFSKHQAYVVRVGA